MSAASRIWKEVVDEVGDQFDPSMLMRGERATGNALVVQVRKLAGEDTSELESAVAASFANLRSQGATILVVSIRKALRRGLQEALLATFSAIHPVAGGVAGAIANSLEALDGEDG